MKLPELKNLFRSEAFDRVFPFLFSDEDIEMWFNEAIVEACVRKQLIRENSSIHFTQYDFRQGARIYPRDQRMTEIVYASLLYKGQNGMIPWQLGITTAAVMDDFSYAWRTIPHRPAAIIVYDNHIEPNCNPNAEYTIHCEGYRLPKWNISDTVTAEVLSAGTLEIIGGAGAFSTVTVDGIDILGSTVSYNTSLAQTASDIATQINANQNRYAASSVGAIITITDTPDTGRMHNGKLIGATITGTIAYTVSPMAGGIDGTVDEPEINAMHHRFLTKWVLHRAYERPDTETMDKDKSAKSLAEFEAYFGTRPDAELRKMANASTPHRNLAYS